MLTLRARENNQLKFLIFTNLSPLNVLANTSKHAGSVWSSSTAR